jgi:hypothetical protein
MPAEVIVQSTAWAFVLWAYETGASLGPMSAIWG